MPTTQGAAPLSANFPFGFSMGLAVQQMPVLNSYPGRVFWVDSNTGDDGGPGTFQKPWATVQNAVTKASTGNYNNAPSANRGDIIACKANHAETISTATQMNLSVAGLTVMGMGSGLQRATFTLGTVTTSTITVSANNISFVNCGFKANLANVASLFTLTTAKGFTLNSCLVQDTSAILNFLSLITTSATSNANDGLQILNSQFNLLATSGVVNLLAAVGTHDNITISGNIYTAQTTGTGAVIPITAGKVLTNCNIIGNLWNLQNASGTSTGYLITTNGSTNSGFIHGNYDHCLATTPLLVTSSSGFVYGANYHSDQADLQGYLVPAADV